MKKGDFIWIASLLVWVVVLVTPISREAFLVFTSSHPYLGGFIKFSILATMGDLLGVRLVKGEYIIPKGIIYRIIVWGIIGMMISLVFTIFMGGSLIAQKSGLLPFVNSALAQAFFGSTVMNLTFGPMMMVFHRFMDLYIDAKYEKLGKINLSILVDRVDWHSLVEFSWVKTCTMFWIPVHTAVFLLPSEYRVLASAFLSIALGMLLALAKKGKIEKLV
ncbi:hypothetical protein J2Z76_003142 [Sedimentibacter acidaminivorans]|uniref:Mpv17 / PMP22 family protein n=1 Tax=Sedimentibacter acidaminivorans TaxID=913099 RepID=A0ABS4GHT2_9FIRM|nr:hypothetical protein [Sedimentibacter acidaminivorans]MBP1927245.1 hypothetical protein [Sedimentibacter acidaminivorans]